MELYDSYFNYIDNIAGVKAWKIEDLVIYLIKEKKNNIQNRKFIMVLMSNSFKDNKTAPGRRSLSDVVTIN